MTEEVFKLEGVGKSYPTYSSDFARFARWFGAAIRLVQEFWAVHDISFSMRKGESVGLIGQNGAGKSSLLKLIAGTIQPNRGSVFVVLIFTML